MQLAYNWNPAAGRAGLVADMSAAKIVSRVAEGLVPVGKLASVGTRGASQPPVAANPAYAAHPGQVIKLTVGLADPILPSTYLGIPIYDATRAPYTALDEYSEDDPVPVLVAGPIWVTSENAVNEDADVYVRTTAAGGDVRGQFRMGAATNFSLLAGARWRMTRADAGLAVLELFAR